MQQLAGTPPAPATAPPAGVASAARPCCSHDYRRGANDDTLTQLAGCLADLAAAQADAPAAAAAAAAAGEAAGDAPAPAAPAAAGAAPSAAQLADRFLRTVLPKKLDGEKHAPAVFRLCQQVGWAQLQPALAALVQQLAGSGGVYAPTALVHGLLAAVQQQQQPSSAKAAHAALAPCCALLAEAACRDFERGSAPTAGTTAQLLVCLATLGQPEQLQHSQRLVPHAVAHMQACTVPALLHLQQRFGWQAIRPAAEQVVAGCRRDSALLPPGLSLLRQLVELAARSSSSSSRSARRQARRMPARRSRRASIQGRRRPSTTPC